MGVAGIEYTKPQVILLQHSGLGVPEYAARTCYDSFENSENDSVEDLNAFLESGGDANSMDEAIYMFDKIEELNGIESSELLNSLAWVHHHHSIIEHTTLSYLVKGTSRGVLQEHARHRIQAISVRSTRYTMSSIINAFVASQLIEDVSIATAKGLFNGFLNNLDMFVTIDHAYIKLETDAIYDKLVFQRKILGKTVFLETALSKDNLNNYAKNENIGDADRPENLQNIREFFKVLENGKKKRNVGDPFKHIVSDNWKVDMVVTFNLRSLKNYFDLRDSGAAYFQIQWLAQAMKDVTPMKYMRLIDKAAKDA